MELPLHHVDVFTSQRFGGNPLAVFLDADDLDAETMQKIAREMNLSETTFVLRPSETNATHHVRIFTPGYEMPFAGHPTIGTAYVLQQTGRGGAELRFQMKAGLIAVRGEGDRLWMTPPAAGAIGTPFDRAAVARALGLTAANVVMPPQVFGASGVAFLCVLLDSERSVDAVAIDRSELARATNARTAQENVLLFSYVGGAAYSRMFADPASGVGEDPATGSSIAPLCSALGAWRAFDPNRAELTVTQGVAMGRRSTLHARFTLDGNAVRNVTTGGACVSVYEAVLEL